MEHNINVIDKFLGTLEYAERPDVKSELLPELSFVIIFQ